MEKKEGRRGPIINRKGHGQWNWIRSTTCALVGVMGVLVIVMNSGSFAPEFIYCILALPEFIYGISLFSFSTIEKVQNCNCFNFVLINRNWLKYSTHCVSYHCKYLFFCLWIHLWFFPFLLFYNRKSTKL